MKDKDPKAVALKYKRGKDRAPVSRQREEEGSLRRSWSLPGIME